MLALGPCQSNGEQGRPSGKWEVERMAVRVCAILDELRWAQTLRNRREEER